MEEEESFIPNLASMLEVSLVEDADQSVGSIPQDQAANDKDNGTTDDNILEKEKTVENGFLPDAISLDESEVAEQLRNHFIETDLEVETDLAESLSPFSGALDAVPTIPELVQESYFGQQPLLDPKYRSTAPVSEEEQKTVYEKRFKKLELVSCMRLHCTVCDAHIGCGEGASFNMSFHKVLQVLVCHDCENFYGSGEFEVGEDGSEVFCRWCGQGGQVFCCSHCPSVFCKKCIRHNLGKKKIKEISESSEWTCYICDSRPLWMHRALCRALSNFLKEQSIPEKRIPEEKAVKRAGFNIELCCKGEKIPYHRNSQPLMLLHPAPISEEVSNKEEKEKETNNSGLLHKVLSVEQPQGKVIVSTSASQSVTTKDNVVTQTSKIVPVDTRTLLEPSKLAEIDRRKPDVSRSRNTSSPLHVVHQSSPKTYSRVVLMQKKNPDLNQLANQIPSAVSTVSGPPMVRFPPTPVSTRDRTVNKIVLNPANLNPANVIYTMSPAVQLRPARALPSSVSQPVMIQSSPLMVSSLQPPPLVVSSAVQPLPPNAARYFIIRGNQNSNPKILPMPANQNSFPVNTIGQIQKIPPPNNCIKIVSPPKETTNVETQDSQSQTNDICISVDDEDEDVVEVFSNVEESEKLTCDWLLKAFREADETSRLLSSYIELLRRKFFLEVNGKGITAKCVRRFAGKFRYLLQKSVSKFQSKRESVEKEFVEWLNAEREKHGVDLKNNTKEEEPAKSSAGTEQKEPDLLLDMDCESDPEECGTHEDEGDASSNHLKQDLMECSENLSENETDSDPFTASEILERKRKLKDFKPFYSRTVKELLRDKYNCKLLFKLISDEIVEPGSNSEGKKQYCEISVQTDNLKESERVTAAWSGAFTDFLATSKSGVELSTNSSVQSEPDTDAEGKIKSHTISGVKAKSRSRSQTPTVNGYNLERKRNKSGNVNKEDESCEKFPSRKRRRKSGHSTGSNDDEPPRLSPQLDLRRKRMESPDERSCDVSCAVKLVSKVKLEYTDINSRPSTSWASPPKIKRYKSRTKPEQIDLELMELEKLAMEKNLIKPCSVSIIKLNNIK